jgi:hypothetical protein
MKLRTAFLLAATMWASLPNSVSASELPNMLGTWVGETRSVHIGNTPYRSAGEGEVFSFADEPLGIKIVITHQKENRFAGERYSRDKKEIIIGALHPTKPEGIMLDDDGEFVFDYEGDVIDLCYSHINPNNKLATCWTMKRVK